VERCELPQWGVGEAPTDVEFWRNLGTRTTSGGIFVQIISVPIYQSNTIKSDSVAITRILKVVFQTVNMIENL